MEHETQCLPERQITYDRSLRGRDTMAKYELTLRTDFNRFVSSIQEGVERRSNTISLEEEAIVNAGDVRIKVVAYERYAYMGGNRSSLNITFVGHNNMVHMVATATGGSSAMFLKINTWSEEAFLDTLIESAYEYMRENGLQAM